MAKLGRYFQSLESRWTEHKDGDKHLFQYMSDLHLEVGQQYLSFDFARTAPNLILAGDIGRLIDYDKGYLAFLQKQTARYEHVFLVLGNHEFYGTSFAAGVARARQLETEPSLAGKLVLLHRNKFVFEKAESGEVVAILGCPLWSHIPGEAARAVGAVVSDFKKIDGWTIETHNAAHIEDVTWLRQELATLQQEHQHSSSHAKAKVKVLVVTHHAPLHHQTASPQHNDSPVKTAFATDILSSDEMKMTTTTTTTTCWSLVKYWVFGHTHWTTQFKIKGKGVGMGIQVVGNQRGYVFPGNSVRLVEEKQSPKHTFDVERIIQL